MRILIIHTTYKIRGGEDTVVFNEAELLRTGGHKIDMLIFSNDENTAAKVMQMPFNLSSYRQTLQKIRNFKPDVIHVHNIHFAGSPSVLYAAKRAKIPVVMTLHNYRLLCPSATLFHKGKLFTDSVNSIFPLAAIKKGVYQNSSMITFWLALSGMLHHLAGTWKIPEKYVLLGDNARSVFQNSKLKNLDDKMRIKPNFCYQGDTAEKEDYYLYVGRLSGEKGINVLLDAFKNTHAKLQIVGSGPMDTDVSAAAEIYPNIEFLGAKEPAEVRRLISKAKALIFPSVWYETFGMVIIEAFSCGVPVIASAIGEARHLVKDNVNGFLFTPSDDADLFKKIEQFETLDNDALTRLSENALLDYNLYFSPEKNLEKLIDIYQSAKLCA